MEVRDLRSDDWPEVARIYEEGIATGNATFETEVPSWEAWDAAHMAEHRFVAERDGRVLGWIALLPVSPRACYAGVAEISAYVGEEARGQGVGQSRCWRRRSRAPSMRASGRCRRASSPRTQPSLGLLQRFGFRVLGTQERIGRLHGVWRDVVLLERRSEVVA